MDYDNFSVGGGFSLSDLNLSNIEVSSGGGYLKRDVGGQLDRAVDAFGTGLWMPS